MLNKRSSTSYVNNNWSGSLSLKPTYTQQQQELTSPVRRVQGCKMRSPNSLSHSLSCNVIPFKFLTLILRERLLVFTSFFVITQPLKMLEVTGAMCGPLFRFELEPSKLKSLSTIKLLA